MKFAHIADCHIGSWRDPQLRGLSSKAFSKAVGICISKEVDFVLVSGDLFHTSLPGIDLLKIAVTDLNRLKQKNIPVYIIAGSHDFSPSGKTMLDVLEEAGLFTNVAKGNVVNEKLRLGFTVDKKTNAKITGLLGKKGMLEKSYFEALDREWLEKEKGFKIFMFHTAISELKPAGLENMDSSPLSFLPKRFSYYAAGHVHSVFQRNDKEYGQIVYPGPLFPNNFKELEDLDGCGGFFIFDNGELAFEPIHLHNYCKLLIDCNIKTPESVNEELKDHIKGREFINAIVTVRFEGTLKAGKPSDIDLKSFFKSVYDKGAFFVMKNTTKLQSREFEEIKVAASNIDDIEANLIREHIGQINVTDMPLKKEESLTKELMNILSGEKGEGEKVYEFERRIKENVSKALN